MTQQCDRAAWLQGGDAKCTSTVEVPQRPYRMVLLGAPGVGKGTQAEFLCAELKSCQLSTGDVFRAAKGLDPALLSPAMKEALSYMQRGELVPDSTVIAMVRERSGCLTCEYGFLLDGFPRTVTQAEVLEQLLSELNVQLDAVLNYDLPMDEVITRLSGRRTCKSCKTTFHVANKPPQKEGVCDKCGGELYQREDDQPESIRVRLKAYHESTAPLIDYYSKKGLLITISAEGSPSEIFQRTMQQLLK